MAIILRLNKNEALTFEELDGNFADLNSRTINLENAQNNWNTAYTWGNHALAGYLTFYQETDPVFEASAASEISTQNINNWSTAYNWGNHANAGYLTTLPDISLGSLQDVDLTDSPDTNQLLRWNGTAWVASTFAYTETDPVFTQSPAAGIGNTEISNWNTAYGWGDHSTAGYLTSATIGNTEISNWNTAYGWGDHSTAGYLTTATAVSISDTAPVTPANGDLWWDSVTGILKIFYNDPDGDQWVDAVPQANSNSTALQAGDNVSELTNDAGYLTTVPGNETYLKFGTSTSFNPGNAQVTVGNVFQQEGGGDIEISLTVTTGFTKTLVTLDAVIWNVTDSLTESQVALERQINTGSWTLLRQLIFPVTNTYYGNSMFQLLDTHGASAGDTVKYRIRNSMDVSYSSESLRLVTGMCGDTIGIKEIQ